MKILIMGSGGVGGFYGGRLAHAGYDVTFVARGAHLAAMRENGLLIESDSRGNIHVPRVNVTEDPASVGRADYIIIGVKLWDTEAVARAVKPAVGPNTGVLRSVNGSGFTPPAYCTPGSATILGSNCAKERTC